MPDEADRFGGLGDALQERDDDADDDPTDEAEPDEAGGDATDPDDDSVSADDRGDEAGADDEETAVSGSSEEPDEEAAEAYPEPFGFGETSQRSYYVRDETFDPLAANRSRVRAVASKHGLDEGDLSKRELHDAELSVLQSIDDWDIAVAVEVLERRGVDVDEETVRAVFDVLR